MKTKLASDLGFGGADVKLYLASAGCGKTHALMNEISEDLNNYEPEEIAFVTFTKAGVIEGLYRVRALCREKDIDCDRLVNFRTLHSLAFRELGMRYEDVLRNKDYAKMNKLYRFHLTSNGRSDIVNRKSSDDRLLDEYMLLRSKTKNLSTTRSPAQMAGLQRFIRCYNMYKKAKGKYDYTDCLEKFVSRNKPLEDVKVAYIDEAQDLTQLQWEVVRVMFNGVEKVRIAADDVQSIFTYAGAKPEEIISLSQTENTVKLEKSKRLSKKVYLYCKAITSTIMNKVEKDFVPDNNRQGTVLRGLPKELIAQGIWQAGDKCKWKSGKWMCLFRVQWKTDGLAKLLRDYVVPYRNGTRFCLDVKKLRTIKTYNKLASGGGSLEAREKFANKHKVSSWQNNWTQCNIVEGVEDKIRYAKYIDKFGLDRLIEMATDNKTYCQINTIHKVKGMEADNVVVFLDGSRKVLASAMQDFDSEMRVYYVACSRAKKNLIIARQEGQFGFQRQESLVFERYKKLLKENGEAEDVVGA